MYLPLEEEEEVFVGLLYLCKHYPIPAAVLNALLDHSLL
jgi:hypothetical protein